MPELPELDVVAEVLNRRVVGQTIIGVEVIPPGGIIVVRDLTHAGLTETLAGQTLSTVTRRGKFLIFQVSNSPICLALNPKLTGRLQLAAPKEKKMPKTHVIFSLSGGGQLRYVDQKQMGQLYLTADLAQVPDFAEMGPEALEISAVDFRARLKRFSGEIKSALTQSRFVAGIGNAYADEILWAAQIHPYRRRASLTPEELERLYAAMRSTLLEATEKVRAEMGENIHLKPRDFMAVHMKTGEPCPRCGNPISLVSANQRITNFCRTCQPGGLIKGM
ncbi:MAG: Fpg/Nei family DNA glycosylase [Anaerolineales bacterium]|nr:Fpg/Nei family DNA glycosylase [Anaerolineales bacterium]